MAVERLVALQDHLGALNDATLAVTARPRAFLGERHAALVAGRAGRDRCVPRGSGARGDPAAALERWRAG